MLRDPLASTSRSRDEAGGLGRRLLPLEHSSDKAVGGADWQHPSQKYRLSELGSKGGPAGAGADAAAAAAATGTLGGSSSSQFRIADLGDLGESSSGLFGGAAPSSRYRLTPDASSGGLGVLGRGVESDPSLEDFRRQTEAIKAQIAALKLLDGDL